MSEDIDWFDLDTGEWDADEPTMPRFFEVVIGGHSFRMDQNELDEWAPWEDMTWD